MSSQNWTFAQERSLHRPQVFLLSTVWLSFSSPSRDSDNGGKGFPVDTEQAICPE